MCDRYIHISRETFEALLRLSGKKVSTRFLQKEETVQNNVKCHSAFPKASRITKQWSPHTQGGSEDPFKCSACYCVYGSRRRSPHPRPTGLVQLLLGSRISIIRCGCRAVSEPHKKVAPLLDGADLPRAVELIFLTHSAKKRGRNYIRKLLISDFFGR